MDFTKPKVLGLDISTKTIGWALFDWQSEELLELTHFSPKIKPLPEDKIELLLKKADAFTEKFHPSAGTRYPVLVKEKYSILLNSPPISSEKFIPMSNNMFNSNLLT